MLWAATLLAILAGKLAAASVKRESRRAARWAFDLALEKSPGFVSATATVLISAGSATAAELLPGEQAAAQERLAEAAWRHAVVLVAAALPTDSSLPRMDAYLSARWYSRIPDARL